MGWLLTVMFFAVALVGCPTDDDDTGPSDDDVTTDDDTAMPDDDSAWPVDADGDGWSVKDGDCDDGDAGVYPGAEEVPYDGIDQDCAGGDLTDVDGDGYDAEEVGGEDCDDSATTVHPDAEEYCDDLDNDCDGTVDEGLHTDDDGDGLTECDGDCDDADPDTYLGAEELCDGRDNDCDWWFGEEEVDEDLDGVMVCSGDCDDEDPTVYPGAEEVCDGIPDNDCDGVDDPDEVDDDGDGSSECDGDCDDSDPARYPDADELCDGLDTNCDGWTIPTDEDDDGDGSYECDGDCDDHDASLTLDDLDGDTYSTCDGDCDDTDATINPSVAEVVDGVDNDCDGVVDTDEVQCTVTVPVDFPTIQDAIDAATNGDVVCVEPGTYVETIDFLGKDIELIGLAGRAATVIDGNGMGSVVTFENGEGPGAVLQGFTVTGGETTTGGGIFILDSSPTLTSDTISGNVASNWAGGVMVSNSSSTLVDLIITQNEAAVIAGGIYVGTGDDVHLGDSWITENTSGSDGGGGVISTSSIEIVQVRIGRNISGGSYGGLSCTESELSISDVQFNQNEATWLTGGLRIDESAASLTDVMFWGNVASGDGGGLLVDGSNGVSLQRVVLANNEGGAATYCGGGGAAVVDSANVTFDSVVVADNIGKGLCVSNGDYFVLTNFIVAGNQGKGLYFDYSGQPELSRGFISTNTSSSQYGGGLELFSASPSLSNLVFASNTVDFAGGAIRAESGSGLDMYNVTVHRNEALQGSGGGVSTPSGVQGPFTNASFSDNESASNGGGIAGYVATVSHCNAYDNVPDNYAGMTDPTGTNGNISVDPLYLDTSSPYAMQWDLHLDVGSPLIDAGDPSLLDPDGSPSDIGAFGGPGAGSFDLDWDGYPMWWQPGPYDHATYPALGWDCDDLDPDVYPGNGC